MQKRLQRIKKLVELAQEELEQASAILAGIQQQINLQESQLESLRNYQSEYLKQLTRKESTTLQQLNTTQAFLDKLNIAIDQQINEITRLEEAAEMAKQTWQEQRIREQSLVKLYEKLEKDHHFQLNKAEQKMLDDLSCRNFYLNQSVDE